MAENRPALWRAEGGRASHMAMLESIRPQLPQAEARVADLILNDPVRVLHLPISQVAAESQVAASTVVRMCGRLGVTGFQEFKLAIAAELAGLGRLSPLGGQPQDGEVDPHDPASVVRAVFELGIANLTSTAGLLDPGEVERAARAIVAARHIAIYGKALITSAIGQILQARLLVSGTFSTLQAYPFEESSAGLLRAGDLALALSQSGESKGTVDALAAARQGGATTVCVTNTPGSALTRHADICLLAAAQSVELANQRPSSVTSMLAVIDAISAFVLLLRYHRYHSIGEDS